MHDRYPVETFDDDYTDDGTMQENVETLAQKVIGHRILKAEQRQITYNPYAPYGYERTETALVLTLDDGSEVRLLDTDDCCAFTALESFWIDPESVDHVITGVGTSEGFTTWHIFADLGDMMRLKLDWSPGNPFYYGYGFDISVAQITEAT